MKIGAKWRVKLESIIIIISSSSSSSFSVIHAIINHMRYLILLSGGTVCLSVCPSLTPYRDEPQNIMTTTAIAATATETALNDQRSRRYPIEFCFSWLLGQELWTVLLFPNWRLSMIYCQQVIIWWGFDVFCPIMSPLPKEFRTWRWKLLCLASLPRVFCLLYART